MTKIIGETVHLPMKDGTSRILEAGQPVPGWASKRIPKHIPVYDDAESVEEADPGLEIARATAADLGLETADKSEAELQADIAAETQRRNDEVAGGTPNADKSDDDLRAALTSIGQPTEGDHDELVARLNEHGE